MYNVDSREVLLFDLIELLSLVVVFLAQRVQNFFVLIVVPNAVKGIDRLGLLISLALPRLIALACELLSSSDEEKEQEEEECVGETTQSQTVAARSCYFCSGSPAIDHTREAITTATTSPTAAATATTTSASTSASIINSKESEDEQELDFFIHTRGSADVSSCTASVRSVEVQDTTTGSAMSPLSYEDHHHNRNNNNSDHNNNNNRIYVASLRTDAVAAFGKPNHLQKFHALMGDKSSFDSSPNPPQPKPTKSLPLIHPGQGKNEEKFSSSSSSSPRPKPQQQQARSSSHSHYSLRKRDPLCVDNEYQRGRFPSKQLAVHQEAAPDRKDQVENRSRVGDGVVCFKTGDKVNQSAGWDPSFVRLLARPVDGLMEHSAVQDDSSHHKATMIMDRSIMDKPDSLSKLPCISFRHARDQAKINVFCATRTVEIVFDDEDASNSQFVRYNCSTRHLQAILKNPIAESQVIQALCVAHNHG